MISSPPEPVFLSRSGHFCIRDALTPVETAGSLDGRWVVPTRSTGGEQMSSRDGIASEGARVVARAVTVVCLAAILLPGCGKPKTGDPRLDLEPVQGFSLASAKFKPFKHRPTAKELYERMYALYSSFDSMAASQDTAGHFPGHEWPAEHTEYRFRKPDKQLDCFSSGDFTDLDICNGKKRLRYDPAKNAYWPAKHMSPPDVEPPAEWLGVSPWAQALSSWSIKLRQDATVHGVPVYILAMRMKPGLTRREEITSFTRLVHIGQRDLLPRKIEKKTEQTDGTVDRSTITFSGIHADSPIPDRLFSTKPPSGSRPLRARKTGRKSYGLE